MENDLLLRIDLIGVDELRKIYKRNDPFIKSIIRQHKILCGKSLVEMIK